MKHVVLQMCQTKLKMMTVYTLPDDIHAPEDNHTGNVKTEIIYYMISGEKCLVTEIVTA